MRGLVIAGPTGVGKTELSIKLAEKLNLEIISGDSMQIYKEMNVGTAKITSEEMKNIKHYMIDVVSPIEDYSVGDFEVEVNKILSDKEKKHENVMLVGGTGLYINAVTNGIADLPGKNTDIRKRLESKKKEELQEILKEQDLESYNEIDLENKLRLVRAIEVCEVTGDKFSRLKRINVKNNNFDFLKILLVRDREELYERINLRVDQMIENGLLDEAESINSKYKDFRYKISAIGYKELFDYFDGKKTLDEAVDEIKKESRRYAKRQLTWFRKQEDYFVYNLSVMNEEQVFEEILLEWEKIAGRG